MIVNWDQHIALILYGNQRMKREGILVATSSEMANSNQNLYKTHQEIRLTDKIHLKGRETYHPKTLTTNKYNVSTKPN